MTQAAFSEPNREPANDPLRASTGKRPPQLLKRCSIQAAYALAPLVLLGTVALSTGAGRHRLLVLGLGIALSAVLAMTGGDANTRDRHRKPAKSLHTAPPGVRTASIPAQPSDPDTLSS